MSFVAYCEKEHINKKNAKDVLPKEQEHIYYCQNKNCDCQFKISAINSNKMRAHFVKLQSSNHIAGCWNDISLSTSGDKDDYDTSDFSPLSLLHNLQKVKDAKPFIEKGKISKPDEPDIPTTKEISYIHTIRQLYSVCIMNDDDEEINGVKIKQLFAGRKTSYLYTKYVSGIKLVECSYYKYDSKDNSISFRFPYASNQFLVTVYFDSTELFKKIRKQLYKYERPILIYAEWDNNRAKITSRQQIILLR